MDINQCNVCLDDLFVVGGGEDKECVPLPCGHCYHRACIKGWFDQRAQCPSCKVSCSRNVHQLRPLRPLTSDYVRETRSLPELNEAYLDIQAQLDYIATREPVLMREFQGKLKISDGLRTGREALENLSSKLSTRLADLRLSFEESSAELAKIQRSSVRRNNLTFDDGIQLVVTDKQRTDAVKVLHTADSYHSAEMSINIHAKFCCQYIMDIKQDTRALHAASKAVSQKEPIFRDLQAQYDRVKATVQKENTKKQTGPVIPSMFVSSTGLTRSEQTARELSSARRTVLGRFNSNALDTNQEDALTRDMVIKDTRVEPPSKRKSFDLLDDLIREAGSAEEDSIVVLDDSVIELD